MWLDDEIINFYFARLMDRAANNPNLPTIRCFTSQFFNSPNRDNWASKDKVFDKHLVLIPISSHHHWFLVVFFPQTKTAIYYDSLHNDGTTVRTQVLEFFQTRFPKETGASSNDFEWKSVDEVDVPTQSNSYDCGVFVCQMAERLSRRSLFNFNQSQMPEIRIQMIEQIVAGEIPLPPSEQEAGQPRPSRFDKPQSKQILRLETELRDLRTKYTETLSELETVKRNAANQLEETIKEIQHKANEEIQRLTSELTVANCNIDIMAATNADTLKQLQSEKLRSPDVSSREAVETQTDDPELETSQPTIDETFTRPNTPQADESTSNDIDPDYKQPPNKLRKSSSSQNFEPLPLSQNDEDLPVCPSAQLPPPPPAPINFGDTVIVAGNIKKGDSAVCIHRPSENVFLPIIQTPGVDFNHWLHTHGITFEPAQLPVLTRDLELRRRFLMQGDLTSEEQQFIVDRVPPVYENTPKYLRALAGHALLQFNCEQAFALIYCFSRLTTKSLRKIIDTL
jgi:sentrin-specific protease 1